MSPKETVTTKPIDLSKYGKGKKLRCVEGFSGAITFNRTYECLCLSGDNVEVVTDRGARQFWLASRFVPVEDEAPVCLCGPMHDNGRNRSCPEHGVRCNRADCDKLCDGIDAWAHYDGQRRDYCSRDCHDKAHPDFAKPVAPPVAASPKVDPYVTASRELAKRLGRDGFDVAAHATPEKAVAALMATEDTTVDLWKPKEPTRRERLVAALAAEMGRKPIEPRFPPEGRACRVYRSNDR